MKKIEVAVILGAGFGKRLSPITNKIPKPLVEIGNETILENERFNSVDLHKEIEAKKGVELSKYVEQYNDKVRE